MVAEPSRSLEYSKKRMDVAVAKEQWQPARSRASLTHHVVEYLQYTRPCLNPEPQEPIKGKGYEKVDGDFTTITSYWGTFQCFPLSPSFCTTQPAFLFSMATSIHLMHDLALPSFLSILISSSSPYWSPPVSPFSLQFSLSL